MIAVTLAVFAPILANQFVSLDDRANITQNPSLNPPTFASVGHFWVDPYAGLYIPVTYTVWGGLAALNWISPPASGIVQLSPALFHLANLLVHLAAVMIVYQLLLRLLAKPWPAAAGALLFAIHPLQVESVAWATGMKDVLSGALALTSLWQYVCHAEGETTGESAARTYGHAIAAAFAFVLALLAKPSAVAVPLMAFWIERMLLRRPLRKSIVALSPAIAIGIALIVITRNVQPEGAPADAGHILLRPLIAADALAFYLFKLVWPLTLSIQYDRSPARVIHSGWIWYTWLAPAAVLVLAAALRRRQPWVWVGFGLFVLGLCPVLGLAPFDFQRYSTVADRYAYLAMIGPAFALAAWLVEIDPAGNRQLWAIVATTLLLALLALRSFARTFAWRDDLTLFKLTVAANPRSVVGLNGLAALYTQQHRPDLAVPLARAAVDAGPDDAKSFVTLGAALESTGDHAGATAAYRRAIDLDPKQPDALSEYAAELARQGNTADAEPLLRRAIQIEPQNVEAHLNLGTLLAHTKRMDEALREMQLCVRLDPGDVRARTNYAIMLARQGQRDAAVREVRTALQIDPMYGPAQGLARALGVGP